MTLVTLLVTIVVFGQTNPVWPIVRPIHISKSYRIDGNSDSPLNLPIVTSDGKVVYRVECHNGNYEDRSVINFSGDFQCVLFSVDGVHRIGWNLLATAEAGEQNSDWLNRGRMVASQLRGECGAIPEYGRIRHFRLRGMRVRFEFRKLYWAPPAGLAKPRLLGFTFVLDISPDRKATSETAEKIPSPRPPPPCG